MSESQEKNRRDRIYDSVQLLFVTILFIVAAVFVKHIILVKGYSPLFPQKVKMVVEKAVDNELAHKLETCNNVNTIATCPNLAYNKSG